jgi:hypothetical protein
VLSATLDSNTYISAVNFGGTPLQVLNLARAGFIRLDVSDAILDQEIASAPSFGNRF